jgi:uncharacterized protein (TIGR03663 family)
MSRRGAYLLAMLIVTVGALALRLPALGNRPFHGDEAVHAFKFLDLWKHGVYRYDPNEFHGPTIYYAALPVVWLRGYRSLADCLESDFRLPIALFGAAMVLLMLPLADGLGKRAAVIAGILVALSPACVFYSRYYIQETLLAIFTLAAIAFGWRYARDPRARWLVLAGAAAGLMIATKETAIFAFVAAGCALLLVPLWARLVDRGPAPPRLAHSPGSVALAFGLAASVALVVAVLFLSGFFSNHAGPMGWLTGPTDYIRSYGRWMQRAGGASPHIYPWDYYLRILLWTRHGRGPIYSEAFIFTLAVVGAVRALAPRKRVPDRNTDTGSSGQEDASLASRVSLHRFLALYTLLLTLLYSAVPYKTPWCILSFLTGMILLAGLGASALLESARPAPARAALGLLLALGCAQLGYQSWWASYRAYADPDNPYVYAQPVHDVAVMGQWVWDVAHYSGSGPDMLVKVIWTDDFHWPIAWYLREFDNIAELRGFYHDTSDPSAPVVLASPEFENELTAKLGKTHLMTKFFGIRPGVVAQVWVRLDVWSRYLKNRPTPKDDD